jgi:N-acetylglucosaminyl-diphospho-decaprenol L-rhamnosyltransferase
MVAYEPGPVIEAAIDAIHSNGVTAIVVVDNSPQPSTDVQHAAHSHPDITVVARPDNTGFCAGNNLGLAMLPATEFVLFLNPDAVVEPGFIAAAVETLAAHPRAGALSPKLVRLDGTTLHRTGELDCTGIFSTWYGRTYDRGQGALDDGRYDGPAERVPALCGAAMLCRRTALEDVAPDGEVFDESFFMYKEDIDLSYRLRDADWTLLYSPDVVAGHVRGVRTVIADPELQRRLRRRSLSNDWRIWRKGKLPARVRGPMLGYLIAKTAWVRVLRLPAP